MLCTLLTDVTQISIVASNAYSELTPFTDEGQRVTTVDVAPKPVVRQPRARRGGSRITDVPVVNNQLSSVRVNLMAPNSCCFAHQQDRRVRR